MSLNSEKIIPARRPSGRLSKPSMELLVDNQRLLSHYIEPKKKHKVQPKKVVEEIGSQSNYSEKSSVSSTDKYKVKTRRSAPALAKNATELKKSPMKEKIPEMKNENKMEISNGDKHLDNGIKNTVSENNFIDRTPYVTIELNDIVLKSVKSAQNSPRTSETEAAKSLENSDKPLEITSKSPTKSDKSPESSFKSPEKLVKTPEKSIKIIEKSPKSEERLTKSPERPVKAREKISVSPVNIIEIIDKSEDDLPLSKVYPNFKPPGERPRDTSTLPPKKKIKFIDITELNGGSTNAIIDKNSPMKVPKLKLVVNPSKSSNAGIAKISKKVSTAGHVNGPSEAEVHRNSPIKIVPIEISPVSDSNDVLSTSTASPTRPIDSCSHHPDMTKRCIRQSCTNIAIEDLQWDKEFCSPDCAIIHSKFLFNEWLNQRRDLPLLTE